MALFTALQSRADCLKTAPSKYLTPVVEQLQKHFPDNPTVQLVFHGHSVPAGFTVTPHVRLLDAYPNLVKEQLAQRYPYAVFNIIVTAKGSETSVGGANRFEADVLSHHPNVVFVDYGLNDTNIPLDEADAAYRKMILLSESAGTLIVLLTPTPDLRADIHAENDLAQRAQLIRDLASEYRIGLVDVYAQFAKVKDVSRYMASVNHPNRRGHKLVTKTIIKDVFPRENEAQSIGTACPNQMVATRVESHIASR